MILIGLTGGLGAGESAVAAMFGKAGAVVIDADRMAHQCLDPKGACYGQVIKKFGPSILEGRLISRPRLARIVFQNPAKLKQLTAIIHPTIERQVQTQLKAW